ncbi:MAG: XRE family transcriptional regulator [Pseudonocardiaceae bacterium]
MAKENKTEPNDHLRMARERTASPTHPGDGLTRQELAEQLNKWVWDHHNEKVLMATANYIGRLERGLIRWPGKFCRAALREILGAPTDSALGFVNARSRRAAVRLEKVDRQNLLRGAAALSVSTLIQGTPAALLEGLEGRRPTRIPKRVSPTDVEHTRAVTRVFQAWERIYGGGPVRDAVMGQLHWSAGLLEATYTDELSPELHSAVGDLASIAGYIALKAGFYAEARQVSGFALACAEKAGDWHLRAYVLDSMATQAIWTGQPDEGLTLIEFALVRADWLTATELTLLHSTRGRALAKMSRVQETLRAVGTAEDHFAHFTPADDPPFLANYNAAFLGVGNGTALFDLAVLGHNPQLATDRLTAAAAEHTDVGPRAAGLTKLASLTMATGDPLQAVAIGHEALDAASMIRSRRAADNLRELSHHAAPHQHLDEVAHLQHRIATLLVRTDSP